MHIGNVEGPALNSIKGGAYSPMWYTPHCFIVSPERWIQIDSFQENLDHMDPFNREALVRAKLGLSGNKMIWEMNLLNYNHQTIRTVVMLGYPCFRIWSRTEVLKARLFDLVAVFLNRFFR